MSFLPFKQWLCLLLFMFLSSCNTHFPCQAARDMLRSKKYSDLLCALARPSPCPVLCSFLSALLNTLLFPVCCTFTGFTSAFAVPLLVWGWWPHHGCALPSPMQPSPRVLPEGACSHISSRRKGLHASLTGHVYREKTRLLKERDVCTQGGQLPV